MTEKQSENPQEMPLPISGTMKNQTLTTNRSPLSFVIADKEAREKDEAAQAQLVEKYHSIDTKHKKDKIEALKNINLNPYNLKDPYDGLANSLHRWKHVANDAVLNKYTEEQKNTVASHYYDKMIAPLYGAMGKEPMSKELWLKQAYKEATNYNIEDAYNNTIFHALKQGANSGVAATARAYSIIGEFAARAASGMVFEPWYSFNKQKANALEALPSGEKLTPEEAIVRGAQIQSDNHQFWADALPEHGGWISKATSFISEQAGQTPVYAAMALGTMALGAAAKAAPLTKVLLSNPAGKKIIPYLMAGGEGLAYGTLTRPQEDKGQAWRDAVGFTIFHGLFDVGGMGLKKLSEIIPEGNKSILEELKKKRDYYEATEEGKKRLATLEEHYEQHKKEVANNLAVVGVEGQRKIFGDALYHIRDMEGRGWSRQQVKEHEMHLLDADPARYSPVLSVSKYIRRLLSATGKRLGEIEQGSEEEKFLSERVAQLIQDAGSEMNTHVEGIKEETAKAVVQNAKEPAAKNTLDFYKTKVAMQLTKQNPAAAKMMKPEDLEKLAIIQMQKDTQKALEIAEKKLGEPPASKADNAAAKAKEPKIKPSLEIRSKRTTNKYGEPAVSYSANPTFKQQLKVYIKKAKEKNQSLAEFFEGMEDKDFIDDLTEHFYPKTLKDSKVFFEEQHTKEGAQNPNFLGFMYNYLEQMPAEFGKELENRLIDSMKVQKYMSGRKPTEPQLMYFARAIYNHVDNFLGSGRWPAESNIFRSTQDTMWSSTRWQQQLLREKMIQEKKNLYEMFLGNPESLKAALSAYSALARKRMEQYKLGPSKMSSQEKIKDLDSEIADLMTSTGKRERISF